MATPITPRDIYTLLASGMMLPLAAYLAAFDLHKKTQKRLNLLGLLLGILAMAIITTIMYRHR